MHLDLLELFIHCRNGIVPQGMDAPYTFTYCPVKVFQVVDIFPHHKLLRTFLHMSPRLHVSRVFSKLQMELPGHKA